MTPTLLLVSETVWEATLMAFAPYSQRRVEAGCFWYGVRGDGTAQATVVGVPKQVNRPRNFEISAEALAELNNMVPEGLVVVAQVHSHPGLHTTHSRWDDHLIVSRKVFSLVLPRYAAPPCDLALVGVHVYDATRWVKLSRAEAQRRLALNAASNSLTHVVVDAR